MAGSEALGLGLSTLEIYQLAHSAEVELRTGLGTVLGQFCGGLEVREREGAPGIGEVFQIPLAGKHSVVALHNGPMLTSEFLSNPEYRRKINEMGGKYSDAICRKRDLETFLDLAHSFSTRLGLGDDYLRVMNDARAHGYLLGMAMFGHTLFTIVRENETAELARLMRKEWRDGQVIVSSIDTERARLVA
jgi:pantoate kinase